MEDERVVISGGKQKEGRAAVGDGRDGDSEAPFYVLYMDGNSFSPQRQPQQVGTVIISIDKETQGINNLSKMGNKWWSCGLNPGSLVQRQCS